MDFARGIRLARPGGARFWPIFQFIGPINLNWNFVDFIEADEKRI
jgi:hypothetical protein